MMGKILYFCICVYHFIAYGTRVDAFQCRFASTSTGGHHFHPATLSYTKMPIRISNCRCRHPETKLFSNKNDGDKNLWGGIVSLWDEIIEVSTYGPSERKMLKARRERQKQLDEMDLDLAQDQNDNIWGNVDVDINDDRAWMEAFTAAKDMSQESGADAKGLEYDGYALQDLLISKWGVSLDVDFQRIGGKLYCTVLPLVGYGSPLRSRHNSELDYLMHLQGVAEILHKYDNLDAFMAFVETTGKVPKRGTDSVPFRLNLSNEDIDKIMQQ